MSIKRPKIIIIEWSPDPINPDVIVAYTANGGRIDLVRCEVPEYRRTKGKLYSNGHRLWFSLTRRGLRQVFHNFSPTSRTPGRTCHNGKRGNVYPIMREFGQVRCHILVCEAFHGLRPIINGKPAVCDHKNGDVEDYSEDNVEWVSVKENIWRAKHVLQVLRDKDIDPASYTGSEMDKWFAIFRAIEMSARNPADLSASELLDLFHRFRLVNPDKQNLTSTLTSNP